MNRNIKRSYIREILDSIDNETISFAGGLPSNEFFPLDEIRSASNEVLFDTRALQYSSSIGIESLRVKIAEFYSNKLGFETSADEIMITSGSQQAFDIILKSIDCKRIIVEEPSYIGALSSFRMLNKKMKSFKKISEVNGLLDDKSILYAISDFQNPSTFSYNDSQRKALGSIVNKNDSFIIEDGAYCFLDFDNDFKTPISKYCNKSFHLGSFSKIVAPGLRVGWIRATKELIDKLLIAKESLDLHTSTLNQMILDKYLSNNDIFKHIEFINANYSEKMNFMCDCLEKYIPSFKFTRPNGGMFVYGKFEFDSMRIAKIALEKKVAIVPAEVFYLNKKSNEARLNFTNSSYEQIEKGIKILASIIDNQKDEKESFWFYLFNKIRSF